jgi:N-acetylmuramoyl-L-alanine amidase
MRVGFLRVVSRLFGRAGAIAVVCTLALILARCDWGPRADPRLMETFDAASTVLDSAAAAPAAVVPDAVLNRTRCIVVVPPSRGAGQAPGAVSCRDEDERWTTPWLVGFVPAKQMEGTVLLFILNNRAAGRLSDGRLDLTRKRAAPAGPIVQRMITVTDADLNSDALAYAQTATGITGRAAAGTLWRQSHPPVGNERLMAEHLTAAVTSFFNTITPVGIILHHSAVLPGEQTVTVDMDELDSFHRQRGFDIRCQGHEYHVAYHYLVMPDGSVKKGRPDRCEGAHARGYNEYIGIAVVGDFSSADNPRGDKGAIRPTAQQMRALSELCRELMRRYDIPLQRVLRHSDVGRTRCPGDRFPFVALLRTLQASK